MMIYSEEVSELFHNQLSEWDLARDNYRELENVRVRKLDFGKFEIHVQFNPARIRSTAAKVDKKSIEDRPCFLCANNRPAQQRGITINNDVTLLVNPFPIFKRHLTIPSEKHTEQLIFPNFSKMLSLAKSIPDYLIFYNGPRCGASAPDHLHFQAGNRGFLPIESDFLNGKFTKLLTVSTGVEILNWSDYLRGIITLRGSDPGNLKIVFENFYTRISATRPDKPEPMLNILAYFNPEGWVIHVIPRQLHRPLQFFKEGSEQILLSPAAVDLGGVLICPREEDFYKISQSYIRDIFSQVCINENEIEDLFS